MLYSNIFIQARYEGLQDAEALRGAVELFLEKLHLTDAPLLYAPSQVGAANYYLYYLTLYVYVSDFVIIVIIMPIKCMGFKNFILSGPKRKNSFSICMHPI
jgi:hypothetical protein